MRRLTIHKCNLYSIFTLIFWIYIRRATTGAKSGYTYLRN